MKINPKFIVTKHQVHFQPTNKGRAVVKGKRVNRGVCYGLEIPCEYCFTGDEFSIQWLKSKREEQRFW